MSRIEPRPTSPRVTFTPLEIPDDIVQILSRLPESPIDFSHSFSFDSVTLREIVSVLEAFGIRFYRPDEVDRPEQKHGDLHAIAVKNHLVELLIANIGPQWNIITAYISQTLGPDFKWRKPTLSNDSKKPVNSSKNVPSAKAHSSTFISLKLPVSTCISLSMPKDSYSISRPRIRLRVPQKQQTNSIIMNTPSLKAAQNIIGDNPVPPHELLPFLTVSEYNTLLEQRKSESQQEQLQSQAGSISDNKLARETRKTTLLLEQYIQASASFLQAVSHNTSSDQHSVHKVASFLFERASNISEMQDSGTGISKTMSDSLKEYASILQKYE